MAIYLAGICNILWMIVSHLWSKLPDFDNISIYTWWVHVPYSKGRRSPRLKVSNSIDSIRNFPMYSSNIGGAILLIIPGSAYKSNEFKHRNSKAKHVILYDSSYYLS